MRIATGKQRERQRVAVIGTGILGASVGWHLSRFGADVVFIDAGRPGRGVTDWSFAWVNASNKTARRSYFALNVAGMAAHRELAEQLGADTEADRWWHPTGHLRWTDDPEAEAQLLETAGLLVDWEYRVEVSTGSEIRRRLEPDLTMPDEAAVVFYLDEGWVLGHRLVERLVAQAEADGAEHRFGTAVREIGTGSDGSARTVVLSDGSRLDVDAVVNAAGPDAAAVAELVGRHLPMRREPGVVTRIEVDRLPVRRVMHAPHIELRPDGEASMLLHSREIDALIDTGAEPEELARLLQESARRVLPGLGATRHAGTRVSYRPIPGDGFPSVGAVPSVPGYYEAVSHSGITLGPVLGRMLAAEILDGARDAMLADFRPERFPG